MVTVVPPDFDFSGIGKGFGKGAGEGYHERADEQALQKAVGALPEGYTPRQLLDAVTNTRASPEAKKRLYDNALGVAQFEESKRKTDVSAQIARDKAQVKANDKASKEQAEQEETEKLLSIANPGVAPAEIKNMAKGLKPADARSLITKPEVVTPYKIAQNQAKRFEPEIKHLAEQSIADRDTIPVLETAIINNEEYSTPEKVWDSFLDLGGSMWAPLKSKKGQELEAITPISMASFGQKMGGVLTNRKIELISKKAVGLGKDKNANRLFLYMDYANKKLNELRNQVSNEIIANSEYGLAPADYDKQMRDAMQPFQKMINNDIDLLLKDQKPRSPILQPNVRNQFFESAPEGKVPVVSPQGAPGYLSVEELNTPEYKGFRRLY